MARFPEQPDDDYAAIYLEDTDRPLPEKLNQSTRYAYFKTIARGGKSIIMSCRDLHLGRNICYKKLRPEFEDDPLEQRRFIREARVSAALQHPNTLPVYELGRDNRGRVYFTMKLLQGFTMREILDEKYRERYDLVQLMAIVTQVLQALRYAHSHGVIHRDIKPENILVGPFNEVRLMDWGLAKVWNRDGSPDPVPESSRSDDGDSSFGDSEPSSMTAEGQLEGTIAFMSPEQLNRDPDIDYRADVYSMGVLLYDILARRTPFVADTVSKMTEQILNTDPPRPSTLTSAFVPEALEELALECLAKDPKDRVQSCGELIRRIEDALAV